MWQYNYTPEPDELYHHGVKGMQWGKRRYQNVDGSLTPAGKKRYAKLETKLTKNIERQTRADSRLMNARAKNRDKISARYDKKLNKISDPIARKSMQVKKDATLADFDVGTDAFKRAQKIGNENHNKIIKLNMKAVSDPSIRQTESYKQAKKWCSAQLQSELLYGKPATLIYEAQATMSGKSWTRAKLED